MYAVQPFCENPHRISKKQHTQLISKLRLSEKYKKSVPVVASFMPSGAPIPFSRLQLQKMYGGNLRMDRFLSSRDNKFLRWSARLASDPISLPYKACLIIAAWPTPSHMQLTTTAFVPAQGSWIALGKLDAY